MNLNKHIFPKANETKSNDICTRAKVDTGTTCNLNCSFCYYKDKLNEPFKPLQEIKDEVIELSKRGITEFDLSGGESSYHPEFMNIIRFTKDYGKVTTLTNGVMFRNNHFLMEAINSGLSGILFSVHGWDKDSHTKVVRERHAWDQLLEAIKNVMVFKVINKSFEFRINCTVKNDFQPELYGKMINRFQPDQINFLPLNYWEDASDLVKIDYCIVQKKIKECINIITKNIEINVRYIPFCFMEGYEQYVKGIYQHIYDKGDWNIGTYNRGTSKISKELMFNQAKENREDTYIKPQICSSCKYLYICDGIEKKLLNNHKLFPVKGEKIKDILCVL